MHFCCCVVVIVFFLHCAVACWILVWQVGVQLPTSADNVALPMFGHRMPLLRHSCCCVLAMQQSIDISCPLGHQQQTCSSGIWRPDGTDGRTDGRTQDPALHTQALPIKTCSTELRRQLTLPQARQWCRRRQAVNSTQQIIHMWVSRSRTHVGALIPSSLSLNYNHHTKLCTVSEKHGTICISCKNVVNRAVPNILFVLYSGRIVGRIVYSYSAE